MERPFEQDLIDRFISYSMDACGVSRNEFLPILYRNDILIQTKLDKTLSWYVIDSIKFSHDFFKNGLFSMKINNNPKSGDICIRGILAKDGDWTFIRVNGSYYDKFDGI